MPGYTGTLLKLNMYWWVAVAPRTDHTLNGYWSLKGVQLQIHFFKPTPPQPSSQSETLFTPNPYRYLDCNLKSSQVISAIYTLHSDTKHRCSRTLVQHKEQKQTPQRETPHGYKSADRAKYTERKERKVQEKHEQQNNRTRHRKILYSRQ